MSKDAIRAGEEPGTARLAVVAFVAFGCFIFSAVLEYSLPLFFNALPNYPRGMWAGLVAWQVAPWCIGPFLAGLLARRYGERRVWAASLWGLGLVPLVLLTLPQPAMVAPLAFWNGLMGALMWVGGISLAQVVPEDKKGLANGLVMTALGVGSVVGPLLGRAVLWQEQCAQLWHTSGFRQVGYFLIGGIKPESNPSLDSYRLIFAALAAFSILNALLIGVWGQRAGAQRGEASSHTWRQTIAELRQLARQPRYWALVASLCLCGGPIFQTMNQFLVYRATELGLIVESQDRGWIILQFIRMIMWIVGGAAVGLLAGRRAGILVAAVILGAFSLSSIGVGLANTTVILFAAAIAFEFVRQFMRWSHAGYIAEHVSDEVRATAIGGAIAVAGVSSTSFGFAANWIGDPNSASFKSATPFFIAGVIGLLGTVGLVVFDRITRRRQLHAQTSLDMAQPTSTIVESDAQALA